MKINKTDLPYELLDPSLFCSSCCEVSGGTIDYIDGEYSVNAHCGCFLMSLEDYDKTIEVV